MNKYQKLFLSHFGRDKHYGDAFVSLLMKTGLKAEQLLYSSNPFCGIPIGKNIYDYLRETINDGAYMVYLLSDNYYENDKFQRGVVNPQNLANPMDNMIGMRQLMNHVKELFGLHTDSIQIQGVLDE